VFVRKKENKSGSTSIHIVSKANGRYQILKAVGVSNEPQEIEKLYQKAKNEVVSLSKQSSLFILEKDLIIKNFVENLSNAQIRTIGPELVFGRIFDAIGFGKIKDELFRSLVITRLVYPGSKLKAIDYLKRYQGISTSVYSLYRFLDKLRNQHQEEVEQIAFNYTKKILKDRVSVVFYDLTTLYFEAEDEDDLRKIGFSKDGKFQKPQIMLGLLVGERGLPIGYDIFEGNTFEGHTLIPAIKQLQEKFNLGKPMVVADSALLNKDNLKELAAQGYHYIIGGRIKNESKAVKKQILELNLTDQENAVIGKKGNLRLIVNYSSRRAKKDAHNRQKGLQRLEDSLLSGKLTKKHINNRGYNKYLKLKGQIDIKIDYDKFEADEAWDGLKGYITNSILRPETIINNYTQLWQIEKAFRISKTDLRIRPVFHRLRGRIEAHICIAFVAYTVYKELEYLLYKYQAPFSVKRAGELTHNIYQLIYTLPESLKEERVIFKMDDEQKLLYEIVKKEIC